MKDRISVAREALTCGIPKRTTHLKYAVQEIEALFVVAGVAVERS